MEDLAKDILASIDAGKAAAAYVTPQNLNLGVIYGYQDAGKKWLMRDYFAKTGTTTIPIEKLGPMLILAQEFKPTMPRKQASVEALKMGVNHWGRGRGPTQEHKYLYGKAALEQWAKDLALMDDGAANLSDKEKGALFFANWWVYSQWADAREAAVKFLAKAADEAGGEAGAVLRKAKQHYDEEAKLLGSIFGKQDAFLGPWSGKKIANWTPDVRKREQEILAEAAKLEATAVVEMEKAAALLSAP